jgi:hypothetical protein
MGEGPTAEPQLRVIGPGDQGGTITIRYGGRLGIVPASRPGGWSVTSYPNRVLGIAGSAGPADSHTFSAIAVGEGQVDLTAHDGSGKTFTVRVRVIRDMIQHPQP